MLTNDTETSRGEDASSETKASRFASTIGKRGRDGSAAALAGGAGLALSLATIRRSKGRAALLALGSAALLAAGARQRRAEAGVETDADARRGEKKISDEAHADAVQNLGAERNADESRGVYQSETEPNPRGVSDRSDVETDDGGEIDFVEGEQPEAHRETHLEDENAHDVRLHPDSDDERTEVDLSEAAMADEASEAAGPHPEQSYPAREGTDPEPTSDEAPGRVGEGAVAPGGVESDDETEQTDESDDETEEDDESEESIR